MTEQDELNFAGLLRKLRTDAHLTQEELGKAAGLSSRAVSALERGVNRSARKVTAELIASALGISGPGQELFVAAARGKVPAAQALTAIRRSQPVPQGVAAVVPYRGLALFEEDDAAFFFGRDKATEEVLARMSQLLDGDSLLAVSGFSGAGKSSLLRAGMLARIRQDGLAAAPEAASWPRLVLTPTRDPLKALAEKIAPMTGADSTAVLRELETDPAGFAFTVRQAAMRRPGQRRLLLVVDQFEELFTQCSDEWQRRAFVTALNATATIGHGPENVPAGFVVLAVRADFEARCMDYPQLADAIQNRYLVAAMSERQLRVAITEPAVKAGSSVEGDLVDVLLTEVRGGRQGASAAGVLPLLSHALDQAWRSRAGQAITLADYERTGGIEYSVAASAQRIYEQLTPSQQIAARHVFLNLTATSSDGIDIANRVTRGELIEGTSTAGIKDVDTVLEAFAAERLLTLTADTVEISHEALLSAWPLLRDTWLADTHGDRIVRTRLRNTAAEWERNSDDPSYLYTGNLLQAATETAARIAADPIRNPPLVQAERRFLAASGHAHRRTAHIRQAMIAGLLALTLAALAAAGIAISNAVNATRQHAIALSRQLAAESLNIDATDPVTARQLATAAWQISPTSQAGSALTTLLAEQEQQGILPADPAGVNGVAFSPSGKLLASADADGTVRLWDPGTGQKVRTLPASTAGRHVGVNGVAFGPSGKLLASADADGTVRLWNPDTGQLIRTLPASTVGRHVGVNGVAFSPSGKLLASADADGTVRLWNPGTGQLIRTLPASNPQDQAFSVTGTTPRSGVREVAFSPDGELLAGVSDDNAGTLRLWNAATGQPEHTFRARIAGSDAQTMWVSFSPDGTSLAIAGSAMVQVWDLATSRPVGRPLPTGIGDVNMFGVAFSPDRKRLAGVDSDGTVRLWDPATGRLVGDAISAGTGHSGGVTGVAFSPDGKLLATADVDGTVRLWASATGTPAGRSLPAGANRYEGVEAVAFSPDGKLLASADSDGLVRIGDPGTGQPIRAIPGDGSSTGGQMTGVAFSPSEKLLASTGSDGKVRLWDPATGQLVRVIPAGNTHSYFPAFSVAFSPDGKLLASVGDGVGAVELQDPDTGQSIRSIQEVVPPPPSGVYTPIVDQMAFSSDSKLVASGGAGGTIRLSVPATGQRVRDLPSKTTGSKVAVTGLAFLPDDKLLASAYSDGTVRLWDPATGRLLHLIPANTTGPHIGVSGLASRPDGKLLASADADGTVRLWDPATGQPVGAAIPADTTGPSVGVNAAAFSPDGKQLASADADGTVRLWDVSMFDHPYEALCADVGSPTRHSWNQYAPDEAQPRACTKLVGDRRCVCRNLIHAAARHGPCVCRKSYPSR
jgi:WD40 repeat protein/transcriptional regulator with XRE-family HTH domain